MLEANQGAQASVRDGVMGHKRDRSGLLYSLYIAARGNAGERVNSEGLVGTDALPFLYEAGLANGNEKGIALSYAGVLAAEALINNPSTADSHSLATLNSAWEKFPQLRKLGWLGSPPGNPK